MQEPMPWSTERCVAMARVLHNISQLKAAIPHQPEVLFDVGKVR